MLVFDEALVMMVTSAPKLSLSNSRSSASHDVRKSPEQRNVFFPVGVPRRILRHIGELPVRVRAEPGAADVEQAGVGAVDEHDVLLRHGKNPKWRAPSSTSPFADSTTVP